MKMMNMRISQTKPLNTGVNTTKKYLVVGAWDADDEVATFGLGVNAESEDEAVGVVQKIADDGNFLAALFENDKHDILTGIDVHVYSMFAVDLDNILFIN